MEVVNLPAVSRVAVCGGTHGNELSGVYLVRELQKKKKGGADDVSVTMVISNPRAVQQCRRYVETDLNRCFTAATLSAPVSDKTPYEMVRAQELNALLGPKGADEAADLLCDLHNTTSNMGLCIFSPVACDWVCMQIYRHLQREMPSWPVKYLSFERPAAEAFSLDSVGKHGLTIEIGPQPHGVVRADIFNAMKEGVRLMLDWIQKFNSGQRFLSPSPRRSSVPDVLRKDCDVQRDRASVSRFRERVCILREGHRSLSGPKENSGRSIHPGEKRLKGREGGRAEWGQGMPRGGVGTTKDANG
ncbi:N-acyl-aromatic-L-amino acid amidohydrolase (carboxylate-forming) A-like isoform X2 [Anguilla rostrata]|uniref:N-acyl-aromatic-L-amino acid amidohydrolase (carboxylate-forming) A-like isoform X2 n=1 Tax=Anguilla rostrata TaxID=7938 RepID=UPI0030D4FF7F